MPTPRGVSSPAPLVLCLEGVNTKGGSNGHSNHVDHMVNVFSSRFMCKKKTHLSGNARGLQQCRLKLDTCLPNVCSCCLNNNLITR